MAHPEALWQAPDTLLPTVYDDHGELTDLPRDCVPWPVAAPHSGGGTKDCLARFQASLKTALDHGAWQWPAQPVIFISDPHADAEGFLRSLVAAGAIRRQGPGPRAFALTEFGRTAQIVIGGDCLDKGPSNLDMLDALWALLATGANVHLLAGNHDLRLLLAILALTGPRTVQTEHLFLRMGRKALPLMREIWDRYLAANGAQALPDEATCRARILPSVGWEAAFPAAAKGHLTDAAIAKELRRLREKRAQFDADLARAGLTLQQVYGAAMACEAQFLTPGGDYAWFYERMDMVHHAGSLLFVHAGLDDAICARLGQEGPGALNTRYRAEMRGNPFAFYSGSLANLVRTKYRETDKTLTDAGVARLHRMGIKMVVQGHVNNHAGQRLLAKRGLLHLEGDVTLDRSSRGREGLTGIGAGATLVYPSGDVVGLSSDYPKAKHFRPERDVLETA